MGNTKEGDKPTYMAVFPVSNNGHIDLASAIYAVLEAVPISTEETVVVLKSVSEVITIRDRDDIPKG